MTSDVSNSAQSSARHARSVAEKGHPFPGVTLTCDSESLILDLDVITALGLVVAELVTNSYDHAFPSGKGTTTVSVRRAAGDVDIGTLTVSDDGKGFNGHAEDKRQGVGLVRRLIEQIRGTVKVESHHGTVWTIKFPTMVATAGALSIGNQH
jgi:two-component sensor histidine kinase